MAPGVWGLNRPPSHPALLLSSSTAANPALSECDIPRHKRPAQAGLLLDPPLTLPPARGFLLHEAAPMTYIRDTSAHVDTVHQALAQAAKAEGFGVLHVYDLRQVLTSKGFPQANECRGLEICNPAQANAVLDMDMALNMMLPCRVSVWEQDGRTRVGMVP